MSGKHNCTVLETEEVTHNVKRFVVDKPQGFQFVPGQATLVTVDKEGWRDEERPFTFTSLNRDPCLEFTIKIYEEHDGETARLGDIEAGDHLLIGEPWGAIQYKGPGVFIAGGAGITPFISILRHLHAEGQLEGNSLIFSNSGPDDIILKGELKRMLGENCTFTLTQSGDGKHPHSHIDAGFLKQHVHDKDCYFYVCGPPPMVKDVTETLGMMGIPEVQIITEEA